ncbi:hypothetical protein QSJ19_18780 [Gordonia sp. ABSL11-1]|uniref:hypothetical protein n=1 Tax=Gordonia sp. ABSL11-1 TaxID=3053924 RepID=UPI002573956F|nr:hypothetical protein [Gordonia sp. ABSL11-1]MDL9947589.1 hypothetical protein [Gordonia sp. ABSL11-1]
MSTRTHGRHRAPHRRSRMVTWVAAGSAPAVLTFAGADIASAASDTGHSYDAARPVADHADADAKRVGPGTRPLPRGRSLQPVDFGALHGPTPAAPVRSITPPADTVRIGDVQAPTPQWLPAEQTDQVNDAAAGAEAQIATFGDSVGLDPARSDRVAAATVAGAATGAAVATGTVGAPLAAAAGVVGGVVGGVAGLVAGVPFLPAGLVAGPVAGAATGAAVTAAPFTAIGAGVGAGVGLAQGLAEPPTR